MTGSSTCGPAAAAAPASSVNLNELAPEQLTEHLAGWFRQTITKERLRLLGHVLRELAGGQQVAPARLPALAQMPVKRVEALLRQGPSEWDPSGQRLVGLGLTMVPTQHRFRVHGHDLWAWCAGDTLMFPGDDRRARPDRVALRGHRRAGSSPGDPDRGPAGRARGRGRVVCHPVDRPLPGAAGGVLNSHYFRSVDAAASWQAQHPDGLVLPVAEAFAVLRAAWADVLPSAA